MVVLDEEEEPAHLPDLPVHGPHLRQHLLELRNHHLVLRTLQELCESRQLVLVFSADETLDEHFAADLRFDENKTPKHQHCFADFVLVEEVENLPHSVQPKQNFVDFVRISEKDFLNEGEVVEEGHHSAGSHVRVVRPVAHFRVFLLEEGLQLRKGVSLRTGKVGQRVHFHGSLQGVCRLDCQLSIKWALTVFGEERVVVSLRIYF